MKEIGLTVVFAAALAMGMTYFLESTTGSLKEECAAKGGNLVVRTQHGLQCVKVELK